MINKIFLSVAMPFRVSVDKERWVGKIMFHQVKIEPQMGIGKY